MRTKNIGISIGIGLLTATVWFTVFNRLSEPLRSKGWLLFVAVPIIFVFGLYLGKWLSAWKPFFNQFAKFVMVGFLNAGIDFAIFNFFLHYTGIEQGHQIALFKSLSFLAAFINSYFWNKYWVFGAGASQNEGKEFASYLFVTLVGFGINVGITSLIANGIAPQFGTTQIGWDNIAAVIATVGNLVWNFTGYHLVVFAKQKVGSHG